jgi:ribosomal protein S17E
MFVFTEQGVSMLSAVLRSPIAVRMSIVIMRAFVAMRNYITSTTVISAELSEIRTKIELLERENELTRGDVNDLSEKTHEDLDNIYDALGVLSAKVMDPPKRPRNRIGYVTSSMLKEEEEEREANGRE